MPNSKINTIKSIDLKEIDQQFDHLRELIEKKIQLQQDLAFLKSIANPPGICININDIIKKKKAWSNENFESLTGYTLKEACDMGEQYFQRTYHQEDRQLFEKSIREVKNLDKKELYSGLYRLYTKCSKMKWFYLIGSVFKYTSNNEPWLTLGIAIDITEKVMNGEKCLEELMQENLALKFKGIKELLSGREKEILKRIARGHTSHEIADELFLSCHTVGTHRKHILKKLEMKSTAELIKVASKSGLV